MTPGQGEDKPDLPDRSKDAVKPEHEKPRKPGDDGSVKPDGSVQTDKKPKDGEQG